MRTDDLSPGCYNKSTLEAVIPGTVLSSGSCRYELRNNGTGTFAGIYLCHCLSEMSTSEVKKKKKAIHVGYNLFLFSNLKCQRCINNNTS